MQKKWLVFWGVAAVGLSLFQGCGSLSSLFISAQDERTLGAEFDAQVKDGSMLESGEAIFVPKTAADQALVRYFDSLGQRVVAAIDADDWDHLLPDGVAKSNFFTFQIIKSSTVNAFAVPGGFVYFYTGIFKEFKNESELIGVLSHEVGHIVLHHSREALMKQYAGSAALDVLLGEGSAGALVGQLGLSLTLLSSSRENEFEADSMGVYFTRKTGVAPTGIETFFSRGVEWKGSQCVDPTGTSGAWAVFSTHPPSCDRIAAVKKAVSETDRSMSTQEEYYQSIAWSSDLSF